MGTGVKFTVGELIAYSIRDSDNIAFKKLLSLYGREGFKEFVAELGGNPESINNVLYSGNGAEMTAKEAGLYAKSIYEYIESDNLYASQLKVELMSTTDQLIKSQFPVARKYGKTSAVLHEMAIVYSSSPYILVIMSDATSKKTFADIANVFQEFNEANFSY
jgi:hypothetical protein